MKCLVFLPVLFKSEFLHLVISSVCSYEYAKKMKKSRLRKLKHLAQIIFFFKCSITLMQWDFLQLYLNCFLVSLYQISDGQTQRYCHRIEGVERLKWKREMGYKYTRRIFWGRNIKDWNERRQNTHCKQNKHGDLRAKRIHELDKSRVTVLHILFSDLYHCRSR